MKQASSNMASCLCTACGRVDEVAWQGDFVHGYVTHPEEGGERRARLLYSYSLRMLEPESSGC